MRFGPDLANIGARKPGEGDAADKYTAAWHYMHLYDPEATSPGTNMPSYRFLFEEKKIVGQEDADALQLTGDDAAKPGYQIVPTAAARQLVAYLTGLDHSHPLVEAGPNVQAAASSAGGNKK
jgi:cytochrome c oxidase cbb3-type subunit 2